MNDNVKFRYVDEVNDGNVPIEIAEGNFIGLQFRFDGVYFEEKNEELHFNYDYDIIKNDDNYEENEDLKKIMNNILFQVLDEQMSLVGDNEELLKEGDDKES
tara:strand:- start:4965 stop:5270 length:306 start_codon:yes stop_codon:yes gene_type:complete